MAWVAAGAISVAVGPLVGGVLIDAFGWRSIFLINLPIGVLSTAWPGSAVPETLRHRSRWTGPARSLPPPRSACWPRR